MKSGARAGLRAGERRGASVAVDGRGIAGGRRIRRWRLIRRLRRLPQIEEDIGSGRGKAFNVIKTVTEAVTNGYGSRPAGWIPAASISLPATAKPKAGASGTRFLTGAALIGAGLVGARY